MTPSRTPKTSSSTPAYRSKPSVVGWREFISFPEWKVKGIEAKIDTGARTSAVHVEDVLRLRGGRVRFHLVVSRRKPFKHVAVTADVVRTTRIRSSTGHVQERVIVSTTVRIGATSRRIELSLVGRDKMLCRMLLGRSALEGFLIDPQEKYLHGKPRQRAIRGPAAT